MTISTGDFIRSRNPGNAQSIIQSFLNDYLASSYPNSPNNNVVFYTGSYPTRTVPSTYRAAADAYYASLGIFAPLSNQVTNVLTDSNIANVGGQIISANDNVSLVYPASASQAITAGNFTGFSQIFYGELQRYLIYRRVQAFTTVDGNISPAGVYTDSGKALVTSAYALSAGAIVNPGTNVNFATDRVISASTDGTLGGAAAVAFNTYWAALMSNWTSVYNTTGTIGMSHTVCHASCHASCHSSRGRR
jgi:hypothetical protein